MSWSLNIGSVAGTAVRIHITFLLFLGWNLRRELRLPEDRRRPGTGSCSWCSYSCACCCMSSATSSPPASSAVRTPDVVLLPIGGVAQLERIPERPSEEFLVAIAGPAVNVLIALILVAVAGAHLSTSHLSAVREHEREPDRPARHGEFVSCAVQSDPGVSHGWRPRAARVARLSGLAMFAPPGSRRRSANGSRSRSASSACSATRC